MATDFSILFQFAWYKCTEHGSPRCLQDVQEICCKMLLSSDSITVYWRLFLDYILFEMHKSHIYRRTHYKNLRVLDHVLFNSAIHKTAGLTVPGCSMILPGTIPEIPISHECSRWLERPLGVVPTAGRTPTGGFVNSAVKIRPIFLDQVIFITVLYYPSNFINSFSQFPQK